MTVVLPPETDGSGGNWARVTVDALDQVMEPREWNNTKSYNLHSFTPKIASVTDVPSDRTTEPVGQRHSLTPPEGVSHTDQ